MKVYGKYYVFPFLYGVIISLYGSLYSKSTHTFWSIALELNGGYLEYINPMSIAALIELYMPFFFYVLFFSTYIYRHFCNSSVYVFSRCENRMKWYCKETGKLLGFTFCNTLAIYMGYCFTTLLAHKLSFSLKHIWIAGWYLSLFTLWCFVIVLLANIVAIWKGSVVGNVMALSFPVIATFSLLTIDCKHLTAIAWKQLALNPCAYLVADWYNVTLDGEKILGVLGPGLSIRNGYIIMSAYGLLIFLIGMIVVQRIDILENNKER